jgi:hypothetical protein
LRMEDAMRQLKTDFSPRTQWIVARLGIGELPPVLVSLLRALDLAADEGWGFGAIDVERIAATWEMLDDSSTAHGFVLSLWDGRRVYLQYVATYADDEMDEEAEIIELGDKLYPFPNGEGGVVWNEDVRELNSLLRG